MWAVGHYQMTAHCTGPALAGGGDPALSGVSVDPANPAMQGSEWSGGPFAAGKSKFLALRRRRGRGRQKLRECLRLYPAVM